MQRHLIDEYLDQILQQLEDNSDGAVADYIPELAAVDPDKFAAAICTDEGHIYSGALHPGDDEHEFTIQSISKPFVYAAALSEQGIDKVRATVGVEPSGEAFNELSLDPGSNRPMNPMINAGAIAVNQLINGEESTVEARTDKIVQFFSDLAGRPLRIDEKVRDSELETSDRNLSIAHMLRSHDIIRDMAHDAVASYINQCSILVTVRDLAVMAATLANGGRHPGTGTRVVTDEVARQTQAVMASAGMYNAAGRWMSVVGIPAKSGVGGGLIGTVPGQFGIATFSPRLDEQGNSERGKEVFRRLSRDMDLHLMTAQPRGETVIRSIVTRDDATIITVQGKIDFSAAENLWRGVDNREIGDPRIIMDLSRVVGFNKVGRRMILEGLGRLHRAGCTIQLFDPNNVLPQPDMGGGAYPDFVDL